RLVKSRTNTKGNNSITINNLNDGIYFITLTTDTQKQFVSKLIVR
ncbi:T9SS type A sorting domain-containing protein, partial [Salinivirga cyanobacteriivorans]